MNNLYLNGSFLPASQGSLPLTDAGFTWGAVVTDRARTFGRKLFRLDDHLRRFRASCERAFIPQPVADIELAKVACELVDGWAGHFGAAELSLVMLATPGTKGGKPTLAMQVDPLDFSRYEHLFTAGACLEAVVDPGGVDPWIKHRSRLGWWIAGHSMKRRAGLDIKAEPLFTSAAPNNFIRETPTANFLAAIDGVIVSPPRASVLDGISLQVVEEIAAKLGIPFAEREISVAEVMATADECLLTNTSFCIAPVARIDSDNRTWLNRNSTENRLFARLSKSWSELVEMDILRQFLGNR